MSDDSLTVDEKRILSALDAATPHIQETMRLGEQLYPGFDGRSPDYRLMLKALKKLKAAGLVGAWYSPLIGHLWWSAKRVNLPIEDFSDIPF